MKRIRFEQKMYGKDKCIEQTIVVQKLGKMSYEKNRLQNNNRYIFDSYIYYFDEN